MAQGITACKQYCLAPAHAGATQGNIAYTQNVTSNPMTTVQTINDSAKMKDTMPMLRKIKEVQASPQANAFAPHLILPNRTQSPPTAQTNRQTATTFG